MKKYSENFLNVTAKNGLDVLRLENVRRHDDGRIHAACPACRAAGSDKSGNHLLIQANGKFGCAARPNDGEHRKEIFKLAHAPGLPIDNERKKIVATYDYYYERGNLRFQVVRYTPKGFKQRRPNGNGGWIWNMDDVERILFRLPETLLSVKRGLPIFICEGEKDVLAMVEKGFSATCNPSGANKWEDSYSKTLSGADCIIVADKDQDGRSHGQLVAGKLRGVAKSVRVIELPDVNGIPVKDAHDFFAAGGNAGQILEFAATAPEFVLVAGSKLTKPSAVANEYLGEKNGLVSDPPDERKSRKASQATQLIKFADEFEFFHDRQKRGFVRLQVKGHTEVWPVNSTSFRNLLAQRFYEHTHTAINRNALADAVAALDGRACFEGREEQVFLQVAPCNGNILIDLCDQEWRVIEVTPTGWQMLDKSPTAFIRTGAMQPLPVPVPSEDGSLDPLWKLLNVTPKQRPLLAGALLNGFHPNGPYFVTDYTGEQGLAKSCATRIHRTLIDPNETPLRSPPKEELDLQVQAANNRCVVLDNLSILPGWLSDAICRLATGGGHSSRLFYTNGEEFTLALKRPVILNGIEDVATRPDLAERVLQIELESIPDKRRMSERELWEKYEQLWPIMFSGLLNGLVCALRELPNVKLDALPRMADACLWASAGESAFGWPQGTFMSAYRENLDEGATASVEAHPVGMAIRCLLEDNIEWSGEPSQLLSTLTGIASEELLHAPGWPKTPRALSACMRRLAPALRRGGVKYESFRGRRRMIKLCRSANFTSFASPATHGLATADANDARDAKFQPLHTVTSKSGDQDSEALLM
jgi:hypothetical protein